MSETLPDAENALVAARTRAASAASEVRRCRGVLQEAMARFKHNTVTPEQAARAFIAQGIEERQARIDAGLPPQPVKLSHLDAIRARPSGIDRGYGGSHRRGSFSPYQRGMTVKPESER